MRGFWLVLAWCYLCFGPPGFAIAALIFAVWCKENPDEH